VQVELVDVARQEDVERLRLADLGVRSAASSMIQRWSSSKAVLNTSFSSAVRPVQVLTEPSFSRMELQVSAYPGPVRQQLWR
jgi:hypothetical protein